MLSENRYRRKRVFDIRIRQPCLRIGEFVKISLWSICVRSRISKSENPFGRWSNLVMVVQALKRVQLWAIGGLRLAAPTLVKIGRKFEGNRTLSRLSHDFGSTTGMAQFPALASLTTTSTLGCYARRNELTGRRTVPGFQRPQPALLHLIQFHSCF